MNLQLSLKLKLEDHTSLDDYVGIAAKRLLDLKRFVLVFGDSGSGKSHLLQGLCHKIKKSPASAVYLPLFESLDSAILQNLEGADLVCLDDIDKVIASHNWQSALFHLINACADRGAMLVFSSSKRPSSLGIDLPDLLSRLKSAYLLLTDNLSDSQKLEIIRIKSRRKGFEMGADVCSFILSRTQRDMHHLVSLVEQLDEATLRKQKKITIPFVKEVLSLS